MANLAKQIAVTADNKPGTLAKAAGCLKEAGVLIQGVCAWGEGSKSTFLFLTENNGKALETLKKAGYSPTEREVVTCTLTHRVGSLAEVTQKLGQAGVDIEHCYVTASGPNAFAVFATKDNRKAQGLLP